MEIRGERRGGWDKRARVGVAGWLLARSLRKQRQEALATSTRENYRALSSSSAPSFIIAIGAPAVVLATILGIAIA